MTNAQQTHDDDAERDEPTTDQLDVEDGCGCTSESRA